MNERQITCIVCPSSCRITVRETADGLDITGYTCKRGLEHARGEMTNPMRMLTSTVAVAGAKLRRLPVISTGEVPKNRMGDCLQVVYAARVQAPVRAGDVVIRDLCGTGVDIVAARSLDRA